MQLLVISKNEAATVFAPLEFAIGFDPAYEASFVPPLSDVVVDLKSGHSETTKFKNIIGNLLHPGLFES